MEFYHIIKELRLEKGLTQYKLACELGTTENCVRNWEKRRSEPDYAMTVKIADFFDVPLDYLLGRSSDIFQKYSASEEEFQRFRKERKLNEKQLEELDRYIDYLLSRNK